GRPSWARCSRATQSRIPDSVQTAVACTRLNAGRVHVSRRSAMQVRPSESQQLAARLASGPAFLLLGSSADVPEKTVVAKYPWSGVYTTRTTKTVADHFRTEWRTVTSVGAMSSMASRSRSDLQICFLFG